MAFVWKHPKSQYWFARFSDRDGVSRNRSTKIRIKGATQAETRKNRKAAERMADHYEEAARKRRTLQQARRVITELTEELTQQSLGQKTFRDHAQSWLNRKEKEVSPATLAFYKSATKRFLNFMESLGLADDDIGFVAADHIRRFRNERCEQVQARTANHDLKCVRTLFRDAKKDRLIADDPTEFVESVKDSAKKVRRAFTQDELQDLLAVADEEWRSMILFGLYTGQRLADLALLTWNNLDVAKGDVRLVTRKTGKAMGIPIAPRLLEHIEQLPIPDDPDAPLHPRAYDLLQRNGRTNNLSNDFANLLFKAGLREARVSHRKKEVSSEVASEARAPMRERYALSFHSLRHTAVTMLHNAGVPMAVAQALTGHDSEAMHQLYISIGREALVDAAKKLPNVG